MTASKPRKPRNLPSNVVTAKEAEELDRLRATILTARRLLIVGDISSAKAVLGATESDHEGKPKAGRKGRTRKELDRISGLYANMVSAPGPCRPQYARVPERLDLLMAHAAEVVAAQRDGRALPPMPTAGVFVPDCDVPMSPEDALRNAAKYIGASIRTAWDLLNAERKRRVGLGAESFELPKRPAPKRPA